MSQLRCYIYENAFVHTQLPIQKDGSFKMDKIPGKKKTAWLITEHNIAAPHKLDEVLVICVSHNKCQGKFGSIISLSIQLWDSVALFGALTSWSKCIIQTLF